MSLFKKKKKVVEKRCSRPNPNYNKTPSPIVEPKIESAGVPLNDNSESSSYFSSLDSPPQIRRCSRPCTTDAPSLIAYEEMCSRPCPSSFNDDFKVAIPDDEVRKVSAGISLTDDQ